MCFFSNTIVMQVHFVLLLVHYKLLVHLIDIQLMSKPQSCPFLAHTFCLLSTVANELVKLPSTHKQING